MVRPPPSARQGKAAESEGGPIMAAVQGPRQVVAMRGDPSYPDSDGKPLAENDLHLTVILTLIETLRDRYAAVPMAYVAGDMLLFYERGNRRRHVAPDV